MISCHLRTHISAPFECSLNWHTSGEFGDPNTHAGETYAIVNIMHDVTDITFRNKELNELNVSLEEKIRELEQRTEEITSFAFVASHDMKETLRKIHTFSDWLCQQEANQLSPKGKNLVEKIAGSVQRRVTISIRYIHRTWILTQQLLNQI